MSHPPTPPGAVQRRTTAASNSHSNGNGNADIERLNTEETQLEDEQPRYKYAWHRFRGDGKKLPSRSRSLKNIATSSVLNVLFIFIPLAWVAHFVKRTRIGENGEEVEEEVFNFQLQFAFSFLAIIPCEKMFDFLGEEMAIYVGAELGDLLVVTLNNAVEAALAIFLLVKDRYRLLQTTIIGVVLLHLLLIPGVAFLTGGARIIEQHLHSGATELNHSLLTLGVMTLVLPAAFFAALDRGSLADLTRVVLALNVTDQGQPTGGEGGSGTETQFAPARYDLVPLLSDERRGHFLIISRAAAVILFGVYICSRFYLHNPPGRGNALQMMKNASEAVKAKAMEKEQREPHVGPFTGTLAILVTVILMSVTAEWLVDSIEQVQAKSQIEQEWFGLFLLPVISFAADGIIAVIFFVRKAVFLPAEQPEIAASGLAIDMAIQFTLFWMPFLVIIGWWAHKPFSLLFDFWEVAALVAACFLVNYITADAKTNWAEGVVMVAFYVMIGVSAWFYPGQVELRDFVGRQTVAAAVANGVPLD